MQDRNLFTATDRSSNEATDNPIIELRRRLINRRKRGNLITLFRSLFNDMRARERRADEIDRNISALPSSRTVN
jgi:hypothetical protein